MYATLATADEILHKAIEVARNGQDALFAALEELQAPIYVTDAEGLIVYHNRACIDFAGRTPLIGRDRWCVTWKLYTEGGEFLPHDECPMAVAIRTRRAVRGVVAVAERPDGTRATFVPFPTPLLDDDGALVGAVNLFIDLTDSREAAFLRGQALKCRRLASSVSDQRTIDTLRLMADEYAEKARVLDRGE